MIFIERVVFRWADKITVERDGDKLSVYGQCVATQSDLQSQDTLATYASYVRSFKPLPGELRGGSLTPHVRFANSKTDGKLIDFVRQYGPVNGLLSASGPLAKKNPTTIKVTESLQRMHRESKVLASAFELWGALRDGSDTRTADALGDLILACSKPGDPGELLDEKEWILQLLNRAKTGGWRGSAGELESFLRSLRGMQARECGWYTLAMMLSTFPPVLAPAKEGLIEMPLRSSSGILPALFFMLRRDCLIDHEIRMCDRRDCGMWFKVERGGQQFCSPECSQLQRQRDYWQRKGKEARALRVAAKRQKNGRKNRGTL